MTKVINLVLLLPNFDPPFLLTFQKNQKIAKKQRKSKKYVFNIFASFLAFSTSSKKKEFKFSKVFRTCSTFHASFFKILDFLILSRSWYCSFSKKKYKKLEKSKLTKKKKVEGPILRTKQHLTYKYKPIFFIYMGEKNSQKGGGSLKKKKRETLNLSLLQAAAASPFITIFPSSRQPRAELPQAFTIAPPPFWLCFPLPQPATANLHPLTRLTPVSSP